MARHDDGDNSDENGDDNGGDNSGRANAFQRRRRDPG
jgi:hypothetical protein